MANEYTQTGVSSLVFGTLGLTGYLVNGVTRNSVPNLNASAQNHIGQVVARRYDDITESLSFDAIFNGATVPTAGEPFAYDSETWEVTSVDEVRSNTDYKRVSIGAVVSQYI